MYKESINHKKEYNFDEIRQKDQESFMVLVEKIAEFDDESERLAYINVLIEKILTFSDENPDEQNFYWTIKKLSYLNMQCDQYSFDRAWSQEQVNKIIDKVCENKKDENWQHAEFFSFGLFTTSKKENKEMNTISDQTAKALADKLNRGETIKGAMTQELNVWLQSSQMIDPVIRLELICAILNNPGHISEGVSQAVIRGQADYGSVLVNQLAKQIDNKEINVTLRILDLLESVAYFGQFEEYMKAGGATAINKLEEIYSSSDNYFVQLRIKNLSDNIQSYTSSNVNKKYSDLNDYKSRIKPLESNFFKDPAESVKRCSYSQISDQYGVIYNSKGRVDSFFSLEKKAGSANLELKDVLNKELAGQIELNEQEQINLSNNYKALISPAVRVEIEDLFGFKLKDCDLRTQIQFVNFLSSKKTNEVEAIKEFLNQGTEPESKLDRFKLFLSLEFDRKMGDEIVSIGDVLKNQPLIADKFFSQYAGMIDGLEGAAEEVSSMYNEVFFAKQADKNQIYRAVLKRGYKLLKDASNELKDASLSDEAKKIIIEKLENNLAQEKETQNNILKELKDLMKKLNQQYGTIYMDAMMFFDMEAVMMYQHYGKDNDVVDGYGTNFSKEFEKFDAQKIRTLIQKMNSKISSLEGRMEKSRIVRENEYNDYKRFSKKNTTVSLSEKLLKRLFKSNGEKQPKSDNDRIREAVEQRTADEQKAVEEFRNNLTPHIHKLEGLLQYQDDIENKLDQITLGDFHVYTDKLLMSKFKEIQESITITSELISECFKDVERYIKPEEITNELFKEAISIISTPTATDVDQEKALLKLSNINANVLLTGKIVGQLPREEVARLDLKKISHIEKMEDIDGAEILNQPEILNQIKQIIKSQFPGGDDEAFEEECRSNPDFKLTITMANDKVLSFFSKEQRSKNIDYFDWFIANPEAPIKGLGESTLKLAFENESEQNRYCYVVAKPHVKSFRILVENWGFVSFNGSTENNEYKHHYARLRRFPSDKEYKSKNLAGNKKELFLKTLNQTCLKEGVIQDMLFDGRKMRACKVVYHGQTHLDDIKKTDHDGWLMEEIDKQNKNGFILSRFIPLNDSKTNQSFYAVFEKDSASAELIEELSGVIFPESISHSASKKALSN